MWWRLQLVIIIRRRRIKEIKTAVCLSMTYPKCLSRTRKEDVFSLKTTSYQSLLFKTLVCLSLEELRRPCLLMTYPKCLSRASKEDASMHDRCCFSLKITVSQTQPPLRQQPSLSFIGTGDQLPKCLSILWMVRIWCYFIHHKHHSFVE